MTGGSEYAARPRSDAPFETAVGDCPSAPAAARTPLTVFFALQRRDLQLFQTARQPHLTDVPHARADQRATDRRLDATAFADQHTLFRRDETVDPFVTTL